MDATELAHWRYRVKALERDVVETTDTVRRWGNLCAEIRCVTAVDPDGNAYAREVLAAYDDSSQQLKDQLTLEQYLLEEARYNVELGEVAVPVVPRIVCGTTGTTVYGAQH